MEPRQLLRPLRVSSRSVIIFILSVVICNHEMWTFCAIKKGFLHLYEVACAFRTNITTPFMIRHLITWNTSAKSIRDAIGWRKTLRKAEAFFIVSRTHLHATALGQRNHQWRNIAAVARCQYLEICGWFEKPGNWTKDRLCTNSPTFCYIKRNQ